MDPSLHRNGSRQTPLLPLPGIVAGECCNLATVALRQHVLAGAVAVVRRRSHPTVSSGIRIRLARVDSGKSPADILTRRLFHLRFFCIAIVMREASREVRIYDWPHSTPAGRSRQFPQANEVAP